jgi:hypothetical protein
MPAQAGTQSTARCAPAMCRGPDLPRDDVEKANEGTYQPRPIHHASPEPVEGRLRGTGCGHVVRQAHHRSTRQDPGWPRPASASGNASGEGKSYQLCIPGRCARRTEPGPCPAARARTNRAPSLRRPVSPAIRSHNADCLPTRSPRVSVTKTEGAGRKVAATKNAFERRLAAPRRIFGLAPRLTSRGTGDSHPGGGMEPRYLGLRTASARPAPRPRNRNAFRKATLLGDARQTITHPETPGIGPLLVNAEDSAGVRPSDSDTLLQQSRHAPVCHSRQAKRRAGIRPQGRHARLDSR